VVLVGREEVIRQMVDNNHIAQRYTMLRERLVSYQTLEALKMP
jgi:hypothetical protein